MLEATLYPHFDQVPADEWNSLIGDSDTLAMDLRLLSAFQNTMTAQCQCWGVLLRESGRAVAAAALCRFEVDGLDTTGPLMLKLARLVRRIWPGFVKFNVLFCGLPVPSGASHLRIAPGIDPTPVVNEMHRLMRELARKERARLIVFKELDEASLRHLERLESLGYVRGEVPPSHLLDLPFASFGEYCDALQSRYRRQIRVSQRKFETDGVRSEQVTGSLIADVLTDDVHKLYLAVWENAKYRLEILPGEFFREVARRFGERASMTVFRRDQQIVGFVFAVSDGVVLHNLFSGINYELNAQADLYFNLCYQDIDYALRRGLTQIHLGQTSDEFKARIGCRQQPLWFRVRATNPVVHWALRALSKWVFPPVQRVPEHQVLKSPAAKASRQPKRAAVCAETSK
jgi:predicted N-acyltransferase